MHPLDARFATDDSHESLRHGQESRQLAVRRNLEVRNQTLSNHTPRTSRRASSAAGAFSLRRKATSLDEVHEPALAPPLSRSFPRATPRSCRTRRVMIKPHPAQLPLMWDSNPKERNLERLSCPFSANLLRRSRHQALECSSKPVPPAPVSMRALLACNTRPSSAWLRFCRRRYLKTPRSGASDREKEPRKKILDGKAYANA